MIFDILKKFSSIISDYKVIDYDFFGSNYKVIIDIHFTNKTNLDVKDYLFSDGKRKYSFHWQDSSENCIIRWDNVPHHQNIKTFPYHKHIRIEENLEASEVMNLEKVLKYIGKNI